MSGATSTLTIKVLADIGQAQRGLSGLGAVFGRSSGLLGNVGALTLGVGGLGAGITAAMGASVRASMEFNDTFADVIRTVDDADKVGGFTVLRQGLLDLSTRIPVAAKELADIAAQGGQMNVPAGGLLAFTETVATLGRATKLSTGEAAEGLGILANITGENDWGKLGNMLTGLGNVNVRGVHEVLDTSERLALAGKQIGLSTPQILAMGAAIGDTGIEAEMGGSAISRVLIKMRSAAGLASGEGGGLSLFGDTANVLDDLERPRQKREGRERLDDLQTELEDAQERRGELFTKRGKLKKGVHKSTLHGLDNRIERLNREIGDQQDDLAALDAPEGSKLAAMAGIAGMSTEAFGSEFKAKPFETFQKFLGGLREHAGKGEDVFGLLKKAGISNIRDVQAVAALMATPGHAADLLRTAEDEGRAGDVLGELPGGFGNMPVGSLARAGAIKFSTDAAQQKMLSNQVNTLEIAVGDKLAPAMIAAEKAALDEAMAVKNAADQVPWLIGNLEKLGIAVVGLQAVSAIAGPLLPLLGLGGKVAGGAAAGGAVGGAGLGAFGGLLLGGALAAGDAAMLKYAYDNNIGGMKTTLDTIGGAALGLVTGKGLPTPGTPAPADVPGLTKPKLGSQLGGTYAPTVIVNMPAAAGDKWGEDARRDTHVIRQAVYEALDASAKAAQGGGPKLGGATP